MFTLLTIFNIFLFLLYIFTLNYIKIEKLLNLHAYNKTNFLLKYCHKFKFGHFILLSCNPFLHKISHSLATKFIKKSIFEFFYEI